MARHFVACALIVFFALPLSAWPQSEKATTKQPVPSQTSGPPKADTTAPPAANENRASSPAREEPHPLPPQETIRASATLPSTLLLEDGTPVKLRIAQTVSSADAHVGQQVDFEVLEEVRLNNVVIIPKGGIAWASVTEAQPKRRLARGGKLNMNIDAVRLIDGEKAALRAVKDAKGGGHVGAMTGAMVATAIVFFPAAPLFLFMHGKDITIPKGTEITSFVSGDLRLETAKFVPQTQPVGVQVNAGTPATADNSVAALDIGSVPDGAEIQLDGSFVGNTPSSLSVAPGEHSIAILKSGFKAWERRVKVLSGKIRITADLETAQAGTAQPGAAQTH